MRLAPVSAVRSLRADDPFRNVARLSVARMISVTGTRASWIALVAVIYARSGGSGAWISAALVVQFGTGVLAAPWAGALGDRFDRRRVMIASDLSAAVVFVGFAFVHSPIALVGLAAVGAIAEAPFGPASSAFLVMLVPESEWARATAARASGNAAGVFLGGLVGGAVVAAFGGATAFLLNAASFVISALLVLTIRGAYRAAPSNDDRHVGVWAGVRYVAATRPLRLVVAANGAALVGFGIVNVAEFPLFAHLGSGAAGFGIATAGYGVGTFIGARLGKRAEGAYLEKMHLLAGWAIGGASVLLCAFSPSNASVVILFSVAGVGASMAGVASSLIMQRHIPDPVRARVFAASGAVNVGAINIAMIVGGALIAWLGPALLCALCGAVTLLSLIPAWRLPPRGRLPLSPDAQAADEPHTRSRWLLAT